MKRSLALLVGLLLTQFVYADVKISNLPAGSALAGTEAIPAVQSSATVKTTPADIATYSRSVGTLGVAHGGTGAITLTGVVKGSGISAFSPAVAADIYGLWSGTCNSTTFLRGDGSCVAGNAGTVTSVSLTVPSGFSVTGSPLTTSGTLAITGTLNVAAGGTGAGTLTGLVLGNGTSAMTAYAGTSCTNQFPRSLSAAGAATCASVANADLSNSSVTLNGSSLSLGGTRTLSLASSDFVNQGTTTTVLHGNAAGNPSFAAVNLTNDVTGDLTATTASFFTGVISPTTLASGTTNNYAPTSFSTATTLRITPNASGSDIGGIAAGAAGREIKIINISTTVGLGLLDQDSGSTAANRIMLPSGGRIDLAPAGSITLWYDTTSSRWRTYAVTTVPTTVPGTHTFSGDVSFTATPTSLEIFGVGVARSDFNLQGAIYHDTPLSPTGLASGSTNNYAPTGLGTTNVIRITPDVTSGSTLTGIAAQATGFTVTLFNIQTGATGTLTLAHQSASSTAANRIICPGEVNLAVLAGDSVTLWYDITTTRWRVMK